MPSIAALALPVTNVFNQCILWLSNALDSSNVASNCADHSGHSDGSPSNLSNTNLGNFIDTDTGSIIAGVEPKGKVEGGGGVLALTMLPSQRQRKQHWVQTHLHQTSVSSWASQPKVANSASVLPDISFQYLLASRSKVVHRT